MLFTVAELTVPQNEKERTNEIIRNDECAETWREQASRKKSSEKKMNSLAGSCNRTLEFYILILELNTLYVFFVLRFFDLCCFFSFALFGLINATLSLQN